MTFSIVLAAITLTTVLVIGGFIVVVGILWWAKPQRAIGVNPKTLSINKDATVTFTAQLMYKSWFSRTLNPVKGKITSSGSTSLVQILPISIDTIPPGNTATIQVVGLAKGDGKILVNGKSNKGSHDTAEISFSVV